MTTERSQIYKCEVCGNIIEIMHGSSGELVCCNKPMKLHKENTVDASKEKHVPVLEDNGTTIKVKVGATPHPMTPEHYIEWIEVINNDYVNRKYLKPDGKSEADFYVHKQPGLIMREYCNLHGLWKA
jgi:superoxide reductase